MSDIRGIEVSEKGTYVLMEDVINVIREYGQSLEDPHSGGVVHELATWLGGGVHPRDDYLNPTPEQIEAAVEEAGRRVLGAENVYRVELYPHPPGDENPKWYARSVDAEGNILDTTAGDFQYENAHAEATERWPEKPIFQGHGWAYDSVFIEQQERKAYPTAAPMRERVSPKRMFA